MTWAEFREILSSPEGEKLIGGVGGTFAAIFWMRQEPWSRRLISIGASLPASYYGADGLLRVFGGGPGMGGVYGFLAGGFSLLLMGRLYLALAEWDARGLLAFVLGRFQAQPPKKDGL